MSGVGAGLGARIYIYIYIRFALACAFSLQVYRGCVLARYIFKWFFALRGLVLALGLVSFAWAVVRGFEASFFLYINIFCELPIARPRRPYVRYCAVMCPSGCRKVDPKTKVLVKDYCRHAV